MASSKYFFVVIKQFAPCIRFFLCIFQYILGKNRQKYPSRSVGMKCSYEKLARGEISPSQAKPDLHMNTKLKIYENIKGGGILGSQHNKIRLVNRASPPHINRP